MTSRVSVHEIPSGGETRRENLDFLGQLLTFRILHGKFNTRSRIFGVLVGIFSHAATFFHRPLFGSRTAKQTVGDPKSGDGAEVLVLSEISRGSNPFQEYPSLIPSTKYGGIKEAISP